MKLKKLFAVAALIFSGCLPAMAQAQTQSTGGSPQTPAANPPAREDRHQAQEKRAAEVVRALNLKAGQVVVDIGAGTGAMTWRFAEAVGPKGKAVGADVDPSAVRRMTVDARRRNLPNYEAKLVPYDDPVLAKKSTDVIFLRNAYHHIEARPAYFARLRPALRKGGRVVVVDFVKTEHNSGTASEPVYSREEVIAEMEQAGYGLVREFDFLLPTQYFLEFAPGGKTKAAVKAKSSAAAVSASQR